MKKYLFSVLTMSLLFFSCTNEEEYINTTNTNEAYSEEIINNISSEYASLVKDILLMAKGSKTRANDDYISEISEGNKELLEFIISSNIKNPLPSSFEQFINELTLDNILYNEDLSLLDEKINIYYSSQEYLEMDLKNKSIINLNIEIIKKTRDQIIQVILEDLNNAQTRMSPGDRMIWSQAYQQLDECQRDQLMSMNINVLIGYAGFIENAVVNAFSYLAGAAKALWDYCVG